MEQMVPFPETSNRNTIISKGVYHRSEMSFSLSNIKVFCIFLIGLSLASVRKIAPGSLLRSEQSKFSLTSGYNGFQIILSLYFQLKYLILIFCCALYQAHNYLVFCILQVTLALEKQWFIKIIIQSKTYVCVCVYTHLLQL